MGEAKLKTVQALNGQKLAQQVSLPTPVVMGFMALDLGCHSLCGVESVLKSLKQDEMAAEVRKSIDFLQDAKNRAIAAQAQRVVLATPGDVPPLT